MTGAEVKALRLALRLSARDFAGLLGINPSTVHRWEERGEERLKADPGPARLLAALEEVQQAEDAELLGEELRRALALRGGLFAVFVLLRHLFSAERLASCAAGGVGALPRG